MAKQLKAVIFDYDDTLVESSEYLFKADCQTVKALGLKVPSRKKYFSLWGRPHEEMISVLYPGINLAVYLNKYSQIYSPDSLKVMPGAKRVLREIKKKGLKIGLLSAKKEEFLIGHLRRNNLDQFFDYICGAESNISQKPDPAVFDKILKQLSVKAEEALYIGDQLIDYQAASQAGLGFVAVLTGINKKADFTRVGCRKIIKSLTELIVLINKKASS